jgi:hypothetical protein
LRKRQRRAVACLGAHRGAGEIVDEDLLGFRPGWLSLRRVAEPEDVDLTPRPAHTVAHVPPLVAVRHSRSVWRHVWIAMSISSSSILPSQ